MRRLQWLLLFALISGCERPHRADSLSKEDVDRVLQKNDARAKWEQEVAKCLPPGMLMNMQINNGPTVGERLDAIGATALDERTLVDRNGKVIYRKPEPDGEIRHEEWVRFIKALGVDTSAAPDFRIRGISGNEAAIRVGTASVP